VLDWLDLDAPAKDGAGVVHETQEHHAWSLEKFLPHCLGCLVNLLLAGDVHQDGHDVLVLPLELLGVGLLPHRREHQDTLLGQVNRRMLSYSRGTPSYHHSS